MTNKKTLKGEPFIRISRRTDINVKGKTIIKASAILGAFLLCGILSTIISPGSFFGFYGSMFSGTFFSIGTSLATLWDAALLLLIAAAITPSFKMKFWNIGAEGQVLMGCLGAATVMKFVAPHIPNVIALLLMLVLAIVFGAFWAFIPGLFKAFFGTNETLFTLMMNYVAMYIVAAFSEANKAPGRTDIGVINQSTHAGWLPDLFGQRYIICIVVIALLVTGIWFFLKYTKKGYEIAVLNGSVRTAEYVGINVKYVTIRTMVMAGALCGIAGFLIVSGGAHSVSENVVSFKGYTAVMISWLGHFNPLEMTLYAVLYSFITIGGGAAAGDWGYSGDVASVFSGILFLIILASEFFVNFRVKFNIHKKKKEEDVDTSLPPTGLAEKGGE